LALTATIGTSYNLYYGFVWEDGALTVSVKAFNWVIGNTRGTYVGTTGYGLTNNSTNYIYLTSAGALTHSTTAFPTTTHLRLATVVTLAGVITSITDSRAFLTAPLDSGSTLEGGLTVLLYNNSGSQINKGYVVKCDATTDNAVVLCGATDINPVGVAYENIANGAWGRIVVAGRAEVYVDGNCLRNDWLGMDGTVGQATPRASPPDVNTHFREIGHALTARIGAGLVFAVVHFN